MEWHELSVTYAVWRVGARRGAAGRVFILLIFGRRLTTWSNRQHGCQNHNIMPVCLQQVMPRCTSCAETVPNKALTAEL